MKEDYYPIIINYPVTIIVIYRYLTIHIKNQPNYIQ